MESRICGRDPRERDYSFGYIFPELALYIENTHVLREELELK